MHKLAVFALGFVFMASAMASENIPQARASVMERLARIESNSDELDDAARLEILIEVLFEQYMLEYPVYATIIGFPEGNDRWTDYSLDGIAYRKNAAIRFSEVLDGIERDKLGSEEWLNYDLLRRELEESIEAQRFPDEYLPVTQMTGVQQDLPQYLALMPTSTVVHYEDILARLRGVPRFIDQTIVLMQKGLEMGVTPPAITLRDVPKQVDNLLVEDALASPMLTAFTEFPDSIPERDRRRLRQEAVQIFQKRVAPAFRQLHDFLVEKYLPAARESIALSALPDGEAWYAFSVKQMTTTSLTPREIHEIGLAEVGRIRTEMNRVIAESDFEGSFEAFLEFLRTDPRFFYTEEEDLLTGYRDIAKRADAQLPRLFGVLPRLPYGVEPVPAYSEKTQTTAYYWRGSAAGARPGIFYANTYDLPSRPKWEMEALTLHEAVPGHHLQLSLSQELDDLPFFRRFGGNTAFIEGWGLYSESLGEDMGFYRDPYSKFGQLTYEMWRAIRLVVDTGIHSLGWTRQQAIDYFMANTGKAEHDITVEVDRYIAWPGQALAYKIGELKIKELKALAKAELGEGFDIRKFHDQLLGNGALPLSVLDQHMRDWIAGE